MFDFGASHTFRALRLALYKFGAQPPTPPQPSPPEPPPPFPEPPPSPPPTPPPPRTPPSPPLPFPPPYCEQLIGDASCYLHGISQANNGVCQDGAFDRYLRPGQRAATTAECPFGYAKLQVEPHTHTHTHTHTTHTHTHTHLRTRSMSQSTSAIVPTRMRW